MNIEEKFSNAIEETKRDLIYYDVDSLEQLPKLEDDKKRYLDFIGGTKNFRVFAVSKDLPRIKFIENFPHLIEKELFEPVYQNKGISIMSDMSYAVPGFYVISFSKYFYHCDTIPDTTMMRVGVIIKQLRKGLEKALGIECCSLYQDDKKRISTPVHFWLVPKYKEYLAEGLDYKLMEVNFKAYLDKFKFQEQKDKMFLCNKKIKKYFKEIDLKAIDDKILEANKKGFNLLVTSKCPRRCLGCYNDFYNEDLSKEVWIKFIDFLADSGINKLTITGGDPLSRDDIFDILKYCFDKGFKINLDTVGTLLLESDKTLKKRYGKNFSWDILRRLESIGIPLDGSSSEVVNVFRNENEQFFATQLKIIEKLCKNKCRVSINTVLNKGNYHDMEQLYTLLKRYPIHKWQVFQYMPVGNSSEANKKRLYINEKLYNKIKLNIEKFSKDSPFIVNIKSEASRYGHYLLIDAKGFAYVRESRTSPRLNAGNIRYKRDWKNIMNEYYFLQ